MRVLAIGGEPATGKSTLIRAVMAELETREASHAFAYGRLKGHVYEKINLWVLGIYTAEQRFPGTDRLSMSVQPDALAFLPHVKQRLSAGPGKPPPSRAPTLLFEGDRLMNAAFLHACSRHATDFELHFLEADPQTKEARHQERRDDQSPTFLKSRATKTQNLKNQFSYHQHPHLSPEDTIRLKNLLIAKIDKLITTC